MPMRIHEVHPAVAHYPVVLLPTAVAADIAGRVTGDRSLMEMGRKLMPVALASMAATGLAGLVSQGAVKTGEESHDLLVTHRNLNTGLLALTAVLTGLRIRRRRPSTPYLMAGLAGAALATYSGYLGGRMVYEDGVGVRTADGYDEERSPEIRRGHLREAARVSADNAVHATKHAIHHVAEGEIAPALRG